MQQNQDDREHRAPVLVITLVLTALGLPGIMSLVPTLPEMPGVPLLALLINPLILLALAALLGAVLAPRCGFHSRIAERVSGQATSLLPRAAWKPLAAGVALGLAVTLADHALGPLWQSQPQFPPSLVEAWSPAALLIGILYGGVVEEILMRWGLMSLLVWVLWRTFARNAQRPSEALVWAGLVAAAVVFAASHIPTLMAAGAEMTLPLVIRTIGFNLALGLVFGWIFARSDLESAMLAHTGFHLGVMCAAIPFRLVFG